MVIVILLAVLMAGCSSPTSPTRTTTVPAAPETVTTTPVATPPPVSTPAPIPTTPPPVAFPPNDARFNLSFYRAFVHNVFEGPEQPLRRQTQPPRIYLRTIDDAGVAIDQRSLDQSAIALENTAGALTGVFGLAGLERGTGTREGLAGWITVRWSNLVDPSACGRAVVGGGLITLYPQTPRCRCDGLAVSLRTVKHELGHALGYWHTGTREDLMSGIPDGICDGNPSAREIYHAALAYTRPVGSASP